MKLELNEQGPVKPGDPIRGGARAELAIQTLGSGVLESVRFTWNGSEGELRRYPSNSSIGAGPEFRWADSTFFEHVDHQSLQAELTDLETYLFDSSFVPPDDAPVSFQEDERRVSWSVDVECKFKGVPAQSVTGLFIVGAAIAEDVESENVVATEQMEQRVTLDFNDLGTRDLDEEPETHEHVTAADSTTEVTNANDPHQ